jgi:hypothetical protein
VISEIYCPQGTLLTNPAQDLRPIVDNYQSLMKNSGKEIVTDNRLSEETEKQLEQNLIPEDVYLQQFNGFVDSFLNDLQHPYVRGWGNLS